MRTRHARQIRAGIEAAHLPHRLREIWTVTQRKRVSPLTLKAFLRTRNRLRVHRLAPPKCPPDLKDWVDSSKMVYTYDSTKEESGD